MGLLGKGRWVFGISTQEKWKLAPFAFAIWFLLSGIFTYNFQNIVIAIITLILVTSALRSH